MIKIILSLLILTLGAAYADDKSVLDAPFNNLIKAMESGKSSSVIALFSEGAIVSFDNGVLSNSPGKISENLDKLLKNKFKVAPVSAYNKVDGNIGVRSGIFKFNTLSVTAKAKQLAFRYTIVFTKAANGNDWKIVNLTLARYPKSKLPK